MSDTTSFSATNTLEHTLVDFTETAAFGSYCMKHTLVDFAESAALRSYCKNED